MASPKGAQPPKISAPDSMAPSRSRITHSAVRTSAGARSTRRPVSRISSLARAARVFSFSFVAMFRTSPFSSRLVPQGGASETV